MADDLATDRGALELSRRRKEDLPRKSCFKRRKRRAHRRHRSEREKLVQHENEASTADLSFQALRGACAKMDEEVRGNREETENFKRALDSAKRELMQGITQASDLTSRAASLLSKMESAQTQAERLEQQTHAQAEKSNPSSNRAANRFATLENVRANREKLAQEKREQLSGVQAQEQNLRQAERAREDSSRNLTQLNSRLESLIELASVTKASATDQERRSIGLASPERRKNFLRSPMLRCGAGYETAIEGGSNLVCKG